MHAKGTIYLRTAYLALLAFGACVLSASAQNYTLSRYALNGGAGSSIGGTYSVSGTIGQAAAGRPSSNYYVLIGGFWARLKTVQTIAAPRLNLYLTSTNTVVLSWPSASTGFVLQQNPDGTGTNWEDVSHVPVDNGTTISVSIVPPIGNILFRLKKKAGDL